MIARNPSLISFEGVAESVRDPGRAFVARQLHDEGQVGTVLFDRADGGGSRAVLEGRRNFGPGPFFEVDGVVARRNFALTTID